MNKTLKIGYVYTGLCCKNSTKGIRPVAYEDLENGKIQAFPFTDIIDKNGLRKRICELEYEIRKTVENGLKKDSKLMLDQAQILHNSNLIKKYGKIIQGVIDLKKDKIDLSIHFLNRIPNELCDEKNKLGKIFKEKYHNRYYLVVSPDKLNRREGHKRINVIRVKQKDEKIILCNEINVIDKYRLEKLPVKTLNDFEVEEINKAFFVQGKTEITIEIQVKEDIKKVINPQ